MAPLFTINFVPKLVSNVLKNFCAIPWHQKPTPLVDCWKIKFVEQDFQSVSNLIFTTYVACKNQFQNWFLLAKNPVCHPQFLQLVFSKIKYRSTGAQWFYKVDSFDNSNNALHFDSLGQLRSNVAVTAARLVVEAGWHCCSNYFVVFCYYHIISRIFQSYLAE